MYQAVTAAILSLEGSRLCHTQQNIAEFWNVCTRPLNRNGFGLSVSEANLEVGKVEKAMTRLADTQEVYLKWRRLIVELEVKGTEVHDARLAAVMYVHRVPALLTLNPRDFQRFPGLAILHPADLNP